MKPITKKPRLRLIEKIILMYFIFLLIIGLPLGLMAIKQSIENRSKADTVTFTATVPKTPYNTPNYGEVANQKPEIIANKTISLHYKSNIEESFTITDPDWVPGQSAPKIRILSNRRLPAELKVFCKTLDGHRDCALRGMLEEYQISPQPLKIIATDTYGASDSFNTTLVQN